MAIGVWSKGVFRGRIIIVLAMLTDFHLEATYTNFFEGGGGYIETDVSLSDVLF